MNASSLRRPSKERESPLEIYVGSGREVKAPRPKVPGSIRLAVATPWASLYSETFVAMQMERLPCVLRMYGEPLVRETVPGGAIRPFRSVRGLAGAVWGLVSGEGRRVVPQRAELCRRLRRHKVNRLLANFGPSGVALLPVSRKLSIPLVVHFHGVDAHQRRYLAPHVKAYRELGRHAAAFVAVSEGMIDALTAFGIPRDKIHLARCGVDPAHFEPRETVPATPRFFGVGRFVDKKAPYLTLLAFAEARKRLPGARLILGGTGELLETTRNLATVLKLDDVVDFPGVLSSEAVARQMRAATALVQHSLEPSHGPTAGDREGTPVTVLEAMMTGIPVIATRHAGIGEVVVHGETGLLVEERDVEGMAKAMVAVGSSPELTARFGRAGRTEAEAKYTAQDYLATLMRILESV